MSETDIKRLLCENKTVRVLIYPGEESPTEYHVYVEDPSKEVWFACVLDPPLETQSEIAKAFEAWLRSSFPDLQVPTLEFSFPCGV